MKQKQKTKKSKDAMPASMLILGLYLLLGVLSSLFQFRTPMFSILGIFIFGVPATICMVISTLALALIVVGIFTRYSWAWWLSMAYFGYWLLNVVSCTLLLILNPSYVSGGINNYLSTYLPQEYAVISQLLPIDLFILIIIAANCFFGLILNTIIFLYLAKRQSYFNRQM
jgi:hypothetical protein